MNRYRDHRFVIIVTAAALENGQIERKVNSLGALAGDEAWKLSEMDPERACPTLEPLLPRAGTYLRIFRSGRYHQQPSAAVDTPMVEA